MFKTNPIYLLSFLLLFLTSCNGQVQTDDLENADQAPANLTTEVITFPSFTPKNDTVNLHGPQTITRNILQDKNGGIWLATYEGIIYFDGKVFTNFTKKFGLNGYRIFSLLEDRAGNIWLGTINDYVYQYDGLNFTHITTKEGLASSAVECMLEDEVGNIWFGTANGVSCYNGTSFQNFKMTAGHGSNDVHAIVEDQTGRIWIGTTGGVYFYEDESFGHFPDKQGLPFNNVRTIIEDRNGHLWIGGADGLYIYDGQTFTMITSDFTGSLYEDRKGDIWFTAGTSGNPSSMSLYRCTGITLSALNYHTEQIVKGQGLIFGISEDSEGNIWFGTLEGVCRYDGQNFNYFR